MRFFLVIFLQRPGAPRPVSNEFLSQVVAALQQGLGGGSMLGESAAAMLFCVSDCFVLCFPFLWYNFYRRCYRSFLHKNELFRLFLTFSISTGGKQQSGTTPGYPANATQNEIKIWDHTNRAFANEEVKVLSVALFAVGSCCCE